MKIEIVSYLLQLMYSPMVQTILYIIDELFF